MDSLEKKPDPEDVAAALASFNDISIITSVMGQLGYTLTYEIEETVRMAQQNSNLSIKFKALKHLRELLKEAAEMSGLTAKVSQTTPGPNGSHTTFQAKQMALTLNPTRQIESREIKNDKEQQQQETQSESSETVNRSSSSPSIEDCVGAETPAGDFTPGNNNEDTGRASSPAGSSPQARQVGPALETSIQAPGAGSIITCPDSEAPADSGRSDGLGEGGGAVPSDGSGTSNNCGGSPGDAGALEAEGNYICDDPFEASEGGQSGDNRCDSGEPFADPGSEGTFTRPREHPCIDHRPAGCDNNLFPGVSGTEEGGESVTEFGVD